MRRGPAVFLALGIGRRDGGHDAPEPSPASMRRSSLSSASSASASDVSSCDPPGRRAGVRSRDRRRAETRSDGQAISGIPQSWPPAGASPKRTREACRPSRRRRRRTSRFPASPCATRNAATGRFPLVIVSHGYDNEAVALSWLTENLASKGYVVAAIRHEDPPITDRSKFPEAAASPPARHRVRRRSLATLARRRRPHRSRRASR